MNISLETLRVPIKGIRTTVTIYHITDSHLCEWDQRDHPALQAHGRIRDDMFSNSHPGMLKACFREMLRIAQDGDAIILTGDIIDFPGAASIASKTTTAGRSAGGAIISAGRKFVSPST